MEIVGRDATTAAPRRGFLSHLLFTFSGWSCEEKGEQPSGRTVDDEGILGTEGQEQHHLCAVRIQLATQRRIYTALTVDSMWNL